uniref:Uncharacterized protein n=1 Tax=Ananas comosus var. bracteatus TaxID=296719 RepID=A0A6V7NT34_ANACO|nr:unnamed protein product [Ananas comosus var. bracteatus]
MFMLSGCLQRAVYRYGRDGCTGTAIDFGRFSANPRLGLGIFVGGVPVRGPVYRYAVQILSSLNCRGASPELGTSKRRGFSTFGAWFWSFGEGRSLDLESLEPRMKLLREPSTQGEARDRGKELLRASFLRGRVARRLICVDIWRVWARYREGLCRSRGVTFTHEAMQ